jgi:hypothetical protein
MNASDDGSGRRRKVSLAALAAAALATPIALPTTQTADAEPVENARQGTFELAQVQTETPPRQVRRSVIRSQPVSPKRKSALPKAKRGLPGSKFVIKD